MSELYGDIVHTTNVLVRGECPYRVVKFDRNEFDEGHQSSAGPVGAPEAAEDEEMLEMLAKETEPRQVDANAVRVDIVERAQLPAHTPAFHLASVSTVEHTVNSSVKEDTEMKKIVDHYYGVCFAQMGQQLPYFALSFSHCYTIQVLDNNVLLIGCHGI